MATQQEKQGIKRKLSAYAQQKGSQNKAATALGVSSAVVSQILSDQWDTISDKMWRSIAYDIGYSAAQWEIAQTRDFITIHRFLNDAQLNGNVYALTGGAGSGKSRSAREYAENTENVILLKCNEYWTQRYFLSKLLTEMGTDSAGYMVADMMEDIVDKLKKKNAPLLIIDEADKLNDKVLHFFITLYNELEEQCGIILLATSHLEKRITNGVRLNKKGYREIYSRIGRKFIKLHGVGSTDVAQICKANGVENSKVIRKIFEDSEEDLRRVKRLIHAHKMTTKKQ